MDGLLIDTLANLTARTRIDKPGTVYMPSDSPGIRISDGVHAFSGLKSIPVQSLKQSAKIPVLGATANLTAIGATFADLAAARTAVDTLRSDAEARLDAIEAKMDALLGALTTANLMSAT